MPYKDVVKHRESQRAWAARHKIVSRSKAMEILGGECVDCGNRDVRVLQFDHIIPVMRKRSGSNSYKVALAIVRGTLNSKEIALRCANCHVLKTIDDRKLFNYKSKYASLAK